MTKLVHQALDGNSSLSKNLLHSEMGTKRVMLLSCFYLCAKLSYLADGLTYSDVIVVSCYLTNISLNVKISLHYLYCIADKTKEQKHHIFNTFGTICHESREILHICGIL